MGPVQSSLFVQWSSELSRLCDEIPWELSKLELQPVMLAWEWDTHILGDVQ